MQVSNLDKKFIIVLLLFKPFPNKPLFLHICSTKLLKILFEKEKLLVKSYFSFYHFAFTHLENFLAFS